jgi:putative transposase
MAESVIGLFKTELHRNPAALAANGGPWKGLDDLETATCAWVSWFNDERLHSELGDRSPAEVEEEYRHRS